MIARINYRESFGRVVGYAMKPTKGPELVGGNLSATDPEGMIAEFGQLAGLNTRCKKPVAHLAFSLKTGEALSPGQWATFAQQVADDYGFEQFVAVKHYDTDCEHIHLIGNRIKLDGKAVSTSNDRHRMRQLCQRAEVDLGLQQTATRSHQVRLNKDELEKADRLYHEGKAAHPVPDKLLVAERIRACAYRANSTGDFIALCHQQGVEVRWRRNRSGTVTGVSFAAEGIKFSGSCIGLPLRALNTKINIYGKDNIHPTRSAVTRLAGGAHGQPRRSLAAAAGTTTGIARPTGASPQRPARSDQQPQSRGARSHGRAAYPSRNLAGYTREEKVNMAQTMKRTLRAAARLLDAFDAFDSTLSGPAIGSRSNRIGRTLR